MRTRNPSVKIEKKGAACFTFHWRIRKVQGKVTNRYLAWTQHLTPAVFLYCEAQNFAGGCVRRVLCNPEQPEILGLSGKDTF